MSWLDEELARQAAREVKQPDPSARAVPLGYQERAEQQVRALDALVQQLLADYGDRAIGRSFRGRQYGTLLEPPRRRPDSGRGDTKDWEWHWHLHSYVKDIAGLEVHPVFAEDGSITALTISGGAWQEECTPDEEGIKAALVHAFMAVHQGKARK